MYITPEEYVALVKGSYILKPCPDCYEGTQYVDGSAGVLVPPHTYQEYLSDETKLDSVDYYVETCGRCLGIGKVVIYNDDE